MRRLWTLVFAVIAATGSAAAEETGGAELSLQEQGDVVAVRQAPKGPYVPQGGKGLVALTTDAAALSGEGVPLISPQVEVVGRNGTGSDGAISVAVTTELDPIEDGSNQVFTVVVANVGGAARNGVSLSIVVPQLVDYSQSETVPPWNSCSSGFSTCGPANVMTWSLGSLAAGEARTIHLNGDVFNATDGDLMTLDASVTYTGDSGPVQASRTVVIREVAPGLVMSLTADRDPAAPGEQVIYRIGYGNRFNSTLTAGSLSVTLPADTSFVSATEGGSEAGGAVTWSLGFVQAGESGFRDLVVELDNGLSPGALLLAEGEFSATSTTETARTDELLVVAASAPPIALSVTTAVDPVEDGSNHVFTVVVANSSNATRNSVALEVVVPQFVDYTQSETVPSWTTCSSGFSTCGPTAVMTWTLGTLAAGEARTIHLNGDVFNSTDASLMSLLARVTYDGASTPVEAWRTVVIREVAPGLVMSLTADRDPATSGEQVTYRIGYGNRFNSTLTAGSLAVTLPVGTSFVSASEGGTESNGAVSWALGFVEAGESGFRDLVVELDDDLSSGELLLAEAVFGATSLDEEARADELVVVTGNAPPIVLSVTSTVDPVEDGSNHIFTVVVSNEGSSVESNLLLEVVVPQLVDYALTETVPTRDSCSSGFSTCGPTAVMAWALGSLAPGEARTIHLNGDVFNSNDASLMSLLARVTYDGASTPVEAWRTVVVREVAPGLVVSLTADRDPAAPGEQVTYRIGYGNRFNSTLTAGDLSVTLPAGTSFVSATDGGKRAGRVVSWPLGFVEAGESGFRDLVVKLGGGLSPGELLFAEGVFSASSLDEKARTDELVVVAKKAPPITLKVTATDDPVEDGSNHIFTVVVANEGASVRNDVLLEVVVPQLVDYTVAETVPTRDACSSGFSTCGPTSVMTWTLDSLTPGQTRTIHLNGDVFNSFDASLMSLLARVSYDGAASPVEAWRTVVVREVAPGLVASLTADHDPVLPLERVEYRLGFGNRFNTALTGAGLSVVLPDGMTFVSGTDGAVFADGVVRWSLGTLAAGESGFRDLVVETALGLPKGTALWLEAKFGADSTKATARATELIIVQEDLPPIALAITAAPDPVQDSTNLNFAVVVSNLSSKTQNSVALDVVVPQRIDYTQAETVPPWGACSSGFSTCGPTSVMTWTLGNFAPGESRTIQLSGSVFNSFDATLITLLARVTYEGALSLVEASRSVEVRENAPSLVVAMAANRSLAAPGNRVKYRVDYGNRSSSTLNGGFLSVMLPPGLAFVAAKNGGRLAGDEVLWSLGTLNAGANGFREFTARVSAGLVGGTVLPTKATFGARSTASRARADEVVVVQLATKQASCVSTGTIIAVGFADDSTATEHTIRMRRNALDNHHFFATTKDDEAAVKAARALRTSAEVRLVGTAAACPKTGTARDLGALQSLTLQ